MPRAVPVAERLTRVGRPAELVRVPGALVPVGGRAFRRAGCRTGESASPASHPVQLADEFPWLVPVEHVREHPGLEAGTEKPGHQSGTARRQLRVGGGANDAAPFGQRLAG